MTRQRSGACGGVHAAQVGCDIGGRGAARQGRWEGARERKGGKGGEEVGRRWGRGAAPRSVWSAATRTATRAAATGGGRRSAARRSVQAAHVALVLRPRGQERPARRRISFSASNSPTASTLSSLARVRSLQFQQQQGHNAKAARHCAGNAERGRVKCGRAQVGRRIEPHVSTAPIERVCPAAQRTLSQSRARRGTALPPT